MQAFLCYELYASYRCTYFHLDDVATWKGLAIRKIGDIPALQEGTRSFYIEQIKQHRLNEQRSAEAEQERQMKAAAERAEERCVNVVLATGYARIYEWIITAGLILVTVLASLKLDQVIDWPWYLIFVPFYFIIAQLIYVPITYDVSSAYYNKDFEDSFSPPDHVCCSPVFYFILFIIGLGKNGTTTTRSYIYTTSCTVLYL